MLANYVVGMQRVMEWFILQNQEMPITVIWVVVD